MQTRDAEPQVAPTAPVDEGAAHAPLGQRTPQLSEILDPAEQTARDMLKAEEALRLVHQRFEQTEDPERQAELAAEALEHVERQLQLTRERRRQLDSTEAKLWARQNRLEGILIRARGSAWWHARRNRARMETAATDLLGP
jgi:DNA helicase IV